ncbi:ATP-binding cassette domain-containing protein [Kitasatospora sp. NPDC002227]|uniref:ABC transporter ATP-binding protein n=1 Tax=Kitasatospora sp. NPDC002227 TaxID=3154773 RepID=UPI003325650F
MTLQAELCGARAGYGPVEALHGIDLPVPAGWTTVLLGRNGSGRTTTLHTMAGLLPLTAGQLRWEGRDIGGLPTHRRARLGLTLVPSDSAVFPTLTVADHLRLTPGPSDTDPTELFPELRPLLDRKAGLLSGGQQQLVALARALSAAPRLLLLDEPERGLSAANTARLHRALRARAAEGRTTVLTARTLPASLPPRCLVHVLRRGRIAWSGEPGEVDLRAAG